MDLVCPCVYCTCTCSALYQVSVVSLAYFGGLSLKGLYSTRESTMGSPASTLAQKCSSHGVALVVLEMEDELPK